ncbi:MAG: c-type heme family protein [Gammaproteobacteria bacterium]
MATSTSRRSLSKKFNISLLLLYLISLAIATPSIYLLTKKQVYDRANQELVLLVDVVKSIQNYVAGDLRPHFIKQDIFYTPAVSGIVATARIANYLAEKQPQYYIKNSSDNPLNPENLARDLELDLLKRFREDRNLKGLNEEGMIRGRAYLVSSAPKISKKGCLRCHGNPSDAPEDQKRSFSSGSGYGYNTGSVVGVSLVGVPLEDVQALSVQRSLYVIGAITLLFAVLFIVVNMLVKRLILVPITDITDVATAVSKGNIDRAVTVEQRNDEISDLAQAFELMRRSLITAMKHLKNKSS